MTAGNQCDTCRAFGLPHSRSWLYLVRQPEGPAIMPATGTEPPDTGTGWPT
jgi:hypothetical protein